MIVVLLVRNNIFLFLKRLFYNFNVIIIGNNFFMVICKWFIVVGYLFVNYFDFNIFVKFRDLEVLVYNFKWLEEMKVLFLKNDLLLKFFMNNN